MPNETARLYECYDALTRYMKQISVAVDGKNDSLSTAMVNKKDVKPLGTVAIAMYAPTEDIELKVTPV